MLKDNIFTVVVSGTYLGQPKCELLTFYTNDDLTTKEFKTACQEAMELCEPIKDEGFFEWEDAVAEHITDFIGAYHYTYQSYVELEY